jgi:hypothetical protein
LAISESQLDTWSKQGAVQSSAATYETVRLALAAPGAPYATRSYEIFLQGSYGNDTNIYADSDVDCVIATDSVYYHDLEKLSPSDKVAFEAARSPATYDYKDFKRDVIVQLTKRFASDVTVGNKAIAIAAHGNRRDADVVAAVQFRRYWSYKSVHNQNYTDGICFWTQGGTQIVNYPKQHKANATTKHQATNSWFKPCVRILKNMRNAMVDRGYLAAGVAPSYFLEGMLYNVPNDKFGGTWADTISQAINWLLACDQAKLVCANEQYFLCHPTSSVTWRTEQLKAYLDAVVAYWNDQ